MSATALVPTTPTAQAERLVSAFLAGRNERTMRAYSQDLEDFRAFVGALDVNAAAALLLGRGHGEANALALSYKAALTERGLSAATINRRLAALRSLVKLGRVLGAVPWALEVRNAKAQPYRDTRGPGRDGFRSLLAKLEGRADRKASRDRAILRLLYERGLRRGEVVSLDLEHLDLDAGTVAVLGKGRTARERRSRSPPWSPSAPGSRCGAWRRAPCSQTSTAATTASDSPERASTGWCASSGRWPGSACGRTGSATQRSRRRSSKPRATSVRSSASLATGICASSSSTTTTARTSGAQ